MTFQTSHPALARALAARALTQPTAVQLAVLAPEAANRDLLVSAQTGSGKTVAFGLAMAGGLLGPADRFERASQPLALIIAPTRELAMQVQRELDWLYAETGARVVSCVGGMNPREEARELGLGAHIVVGTPGRLRDHLERRRLDLSNLKAVVLDEADEMLDLGFREDLEFILDAAPKERQTLLFSATLPRAIETLARRYQNDAMRIETTRRNEQHADIEYQAIRVAAHDVENAVVNVLRYHETHSTLVFCATREAVKRLHAGLVKRGFSAVALSGELTQTERTDALQNLRDGRARVLIATDVAARGLDLPDLALVIHADLPNNGDTLLHRSGRTGRAGKKGLCVLIVAYNRRRKAETLFAAANLKITWTNAPTGKDIEARDSERFMADPVFTEPASEKELALASALQAAQNAHQIAIALLRMRRAQLPEPAKLGQDSGPPARREDRPQGAGKYSPGKHAPAGRGREDRRPMGEPDAASERGPGTRRPRPREDDRDMVWFRLNIGRERNADPRWLVPLLCKAGNISKADLGSIKIHDRDTRFQVAAEIADHFGEAVRTNKNKEGTISRVGSYSQADDDAVANAIGALEHTRPAPAARPAPPTQATPPEQATPAAQASPASRPTPPTQAAPAAPATPDLQDRQHRPAHRKPAGKPHQPRKEYSKPPRRDHASAHQPGKKPHRKGPDTRDPSERAKPRFAARHTGPDAPRSTSKYAKKKKHRTKEPVAS